MEAITNCNNRGGVLTGTESLGFVFSHDINWTNQTPPAWVMVDFDHVGITWGKPSAQ